MLRSNLLQDSLHFHRLIDMKSLVFSFTLLISSSLAFAQLDPSSGLLLNNQNKSSNRDNGLDSGRYTVRQRSDLAPKKNIQPKSGSEKHTEQNSSEEEVTETETETQSKTQTQALPTPVPTDSNLPQVVLPSPTPEVEKGTTQVAPLASPVPSPITAAIDEQRKNLLELSFAPTFIYNHSQSEFTVRDYSTSSPGYTIEVNMWIDPTFAIHSDFSNTLGASVEDSLDHSRNASYLYQQFSLGIRSRHFSTNKTNSASLIFGADFNDYHFEVNNTALLRNKIETLGVNLSLLAQLPQSANYMWEIGIELMPKARHTETQTASSFSSGDNPEANIISASLGGRVFIDATNQLFWRIHERIEKDQFLGSSSKPDPAANKTLTNVSVINSTLTFQVGYTWGN